ncbi:hypothetical protein [Leptolyngbya ohadii]|uniref:hypothetical protein n=1 Tax=Leptolyngbya ohadii TaxID=1962290 RepID=UPI000B59B751|nr:hypothetical protein [Leptolyngbya ohadii]
MSLQLDRPTAHRFLWLRRLVALLAVLNLALVLFDLTYLDLRSLYFQFTPSLVQLYDPVKGIFSHPETERYLDRVAALESQIRQTGIESSEVEAGLAMLRSDSEQLVQNNPFANHRNAVLETIQQDLQRRTGAESSFVAFDRFWRREYLTQENWQAELTFWNDQIHPFFATNYFQRVNALGQTIDYFWLLDLPFILIFAIDFALRDRAIRLAHPELSGLETLLRRWYDLFLLLPFWRWLRIVPVVLRLHQVNLISLKPFQAEAQRDFAIGFARELTEIVGVRAIDQIQGAIWRGDVMRWLLYPEQRRQYVQVNDLNEIEAIVVRVVDIIFYQVLPQIQPDLEQLMYYSLRHALSQLPGYSRLQALPGMGFLPRQTADRLAKDLSKGAYQSFVQIWTDAEIDQLRVETIKKFRERLTIELQKKSNTQDIESLLVDMLEEIKINYVKDLTEANIEQIVDRAVQLQRQASTAAP